MHLLWLLHSVMSHVLRTLIWNKCYSDVIKVFGHFVKSFFFMLKKSLCIISNIMVRLLKQHFLQFWIPCNLWLLDISSEVFYPNQTFRLLQFYNIYVRQEYTWCSPCFPPVISTMLCWSSKERHLYVWCHLRPCNHDASLTLIQWQYCIEV